MAIYLRTTHKINHVKHGNELQTTLAGSNFNDSTEDICLITNTSISKISHQFPLFKNVMGSSSTLTSISIDEIVANKIKENGTQASSRSLVQENNKSPIDSNVTSSDRKTRKIKEITAKDSLVGMRNFNFRKFFEACAFLMLIAQTPVLLLYVKRLNNKKIQPQFNKLKETYTSFTPLELPKNSSKDCLDSHLDEPTKVFMHRMYKIIQITQHLAKYASEESRTEVTKAWNYFKSIVDDYNGLQNKSEYSFIAKLSDIPLSYEYLSSSISSLCHARKAGLNHLNNPKEFQTALISLLNERDELDKEFDEFYNRTKESIEAYLSSNLVSSSNVTH